MVPSNSSSPPELPLSGHFFSPIVTLEKLKTIVLSTPTNANGCRITSIKWKEDGYPCVRMAGVKAHASRIVFKLFNHSLRPDLLVRHTCDVRACLEPTHLIAGTHLDNARDREERGRHGKRKVSDSDILRMWEWHKRGMPNRTLAYLFRLSLSYVAHLMGGLARRKVLP